MDTFNVFFIAWPWFNLGAAVVMTFLLFFTNVMRYNLDVPRWKDPSWLAWVLPPLLMIHQFEEYGMHVADEER